MLRIDAKNMNFSGTSVINDVELAGLNANVNESDNHGYLNININNMNAARENLIALKSDIAAFIDEISKLPEEDDE